MATLTHAVFLTPEGALALAHLTDFLRDGHILDCSHFDAEGSFVEVRTMLQASSTLLAGIEAQLLFPHRYVSVVVRDSASIKPGFIQGNTP